MLKEFSKKETNRYELVISVDAEKFNEAIKQAYAENGKKINVPGFRKGKAPMGIIEKYYGESVFFEDALYSIRTAKEFGMTVYAVHEICSIADKDAICAIADGYEMLLTDYLDRI